MIPTNPLQIQCNASTTLQHATFTSRDYWTVKSRAFDYISGPVDFTDIDQLQEKGGIIVLPSKLFWVSIWFTCSNSRTFKANWSYLYSIFFNNQWGSWSVKSFTYFKIMTLGCYKIQLNFEGDILNQFVHLYE